MPPKENVMPVASHTKAASDHKSAASAHESAAALHTKGDHKTAHDSSLKAQSCCDTAGKSSKDASEKSAMSAKM
jgi:hypothetical protein